MLSVLEESKKLNGNIKYYSCKNYETNESSKFEFLTLDKGTSLVSSHTKKNFLAFVQQGSILLSNNGFGERTITQGEFFFLPESSILKCKAITDSRIILLSFTGAIISLCERSTLAQCLPLCKGIHFKFKSYTISDMLSKYLDLLKSYLESNMTCTHLHKIKREELFILLRSNYSLETIAELFFPIIGNDISFKSKVMSLYEEEKKLKDYADIFRMSETGFIRKFKTEFGLTFQQWMLEQRNKQICHQLAFPETTISDIITDYKFSSASHFTKYCKRQFGCTPSELIKSIRKEHI